MIVTTLDYFTPPPGATWHWSECGDYIETTHEKKITTLTHRMNLHETMQAILRTTGGIPHFEAVITLVANKTPSTLFADALRDIPRPFTGERAQLHIDCLQAPIKIKSSTISRKAALGEISQLLNNLETLKSLSPEQHQHLLDTSVEAPPNAADIDLDLRARVAALLDQLDQSQTDETLQGIARLARQLVALVHLPKNVSDPQDLPLGGVSDLSNKGDLDRLLLSELAYDDDILMSRLATREALYLQREKPPLPRPQACQVLLDSTVRMWGTPRIFAVSAALALALRSGAKNGRRASRDLHFYHSEDIGPQSIDLADPGGLRYHLAHLDPSHLPLESLQTLIEDPSTAETLLITHREIFEDPDFLPVIDIPPAHTLYVAALSHNGHFQLWRLGHCGRKCLQKGTIDLSLLHGKTGETSEDKPAITHVERGTNNWPIFLDKLPCPILRVPQGWSPVCGDGIEFGFTGPGSIFTRHTDALGAAFHGFLPNRLLKGPVYDPRHKVFRFITNLPKIAL